jgi:DNA-binding CsgD family transcriptional regulator
LNRLEAAENRLRHVQQQQQHLGLQHSYLSPLPDLVEVCLRAGDLGEAERLVEAMVANHLFDARPTSRARLLRSQALVATKDQYRALFEQSVALDRQTGTDFLRARTLLCYGERLRRDRQRVLARVMLKEALDVFDSLEAVPWSERTRHELTATGERSQARAASVTGHLTPQELQIAALVADGKGNKDVAATLFLSVRTVEFHLSRIYRKLAVPNRATLASRLAAGSPASLPR